MPHVVAHPRRPANPPRLRGPGLEACGEPSATVERAFGGVLDGTVAYEIEAGTLTLDHPGGKGLTLRAR